MLAKSRPRRRGLWPFRATRNRRVRPPSLNGISREPKPPTDSVETQTPEREPSGRTRTQKAPSPAALERRQRTHRLTLAFGMLAAVAGAALGAQRFLTRSHHFAVRGLRFSPLKHVSSDVLQGRANVVLGSNLFAVDLDEVAREVAQEPWVERAHARRELPGTIAIDVVEREAACSVALGPLYLADAAGRVFKRANPDEAAALPVVTGLEREQYLAEPEQARALVREALAALGAWRTNAVRPALGELHVDKLLGVTVYTAQDAVGVRLGRVDGTLADRLRRFDAVWRELARANEKPRLIYLDNRARPDRVTVKLQGAPTPAPQPRAAPEKKSET